MRRTRHVGEDDNSGAGFPTPRSNRHDDLNFSRAVARAHPGRGAARLARAGDRRGRELRRRAGRIPGGAVAGRGRRQRLPEAVRQAAAHGRLRVLSFATNIARTCCRALHFIVTARASSAFDAELRPAGRAKRQLPWQKLTEVDPATGDGAGLSVVAGAASRAARELKEGEGGLREDVRRPPARGGAGPDVEVLLNRQGLPAGALTRELRGRCRCPGRLYHESSSRQLRPAPQMI